VKRKLIIILSLCFLAIAVITEGVLYFKNRLPAPSFLSPTAKLFTPSPSLLSPTIKLLSPIPSPSPRPLGLPAELSTDFDPSKNTPIFVIESADAALGILNLKFVFPHTWEGRKVTSRITCKDGDIKITYQNNSNSRKEDVTKEALINKVQETSNKSMLFSGLCSDSTCMEINKDCLLQVNRNQ